MMRVITTRRLTGPLLIVVAVVGISCVSADIYEDHSSRAFFHLPKSIKGLDVSKLRTLHENIDKQFWGTMKKLLLVESPIPLDDFLENYHQIWLPWQWIGFSIIKGKEVRCLIY